MLQIKYEVDKPKRWIIACPDAYCKKEFMYNVRPYCPFCYEPIIHPGDAIKNGFNRLFYHKEKTWRCH